MPKISSILLTAALALAAPGAGLSAQDGRGDPDGEARLRALDSLYSPQVSGSGAAMRFEARVIDAGTIAEEAEPPVYTYRWTNVGKEPVTVLQVTTTCGCATASFSREAVEPGEDGTVEVTYHPKGHPGSFDRRIFVYTDSSGGRPAAVLSLRGEVKPAAVPVWLYSHRMGSLCLKRTEVQFRGGVKAVERVECLNAGDRAVEVGAETALLPPYLSVRCEPQTIPAGEKADIVVTYDPGAAPARMLTVIPVILTGPDVPPSQRTLTVKFSDGRDAAQAPAQ